LKTHDSIDHQPIQKGISIDIKLPQEAKNPRWSRGDAATGELASLFNTLNTPNQQPLSVSPSFI
jgi:hypothetical protein